MLPLRYEFIKKKLSGQYCLLDENQPFKSRLQVSKALKFSYKTIIKSLIAILVIMNYISLVKSYKKK